MQKETDLILYHQLTQKDTIDWIKENKLVLNAKKTKNVLLNGRRNIQFEKNFSLGIGTAETVKHYKYLGVIIECHLGFQHHVSNIKKLLVKFYGLFYRLRKILTSRQLIQDFGTYIKLTSQYGALIFGSTSKTVHKNLEKITKRLIIIVFYKRSFESLGPLR